MRERSLAQGVMAPSPRCCGASENAGKGEASPEPQRSDVTSDKPGPLHSGSTPSARRTGTGDLHPWDVSSSIELLSDRSRARPAWRRRRWTWLDPEEARAVAAALIERADRRSRSLSARPPRPHLSRSGDLTTLAASCDRPRPRGHGERRGASASSKNWYALVVRRTPRPCPPPTATNPRRARARRASEARSCVRDRPEARASSSRSGRLLQLPASIGLIMRADLRRLGA